MNPIIASLDALFETDEAPADESGVLARLARSLAVADPIDFAVARSDGHVIAIHRVVPGESTPASADDPREALVKLAAAAARADEPSEEAWFRLASSERWSALGSWTRSLRGERLLLVVRAGRPEALASIRGADVMLAVSLAAQMIDLSVASAELKSRVSQLRNEQDVLAASHHRTVTDLIEAREDQIRKEREYVAVLEAEVEKRSGELRQALNQARLASEAKSSFLANMSHEIRTPMTAILGYTDLLVESEPTPEEVTEYAGIIKTNGEHLLQILNDILDLSKIEANRVSVELLLVDVRRLVEEVVQTLELRARAKGVALEMEVAEDVPETIPTDPTKLRQILVNLVGNAVKFTEAGEVRIHVRHSPRDDGARLEIDVRDSGIGMTEDQVARLFQPFSQADSSTTRRFGGTGLGLCISKNLAEILGGEISVASAPGAGSTFHVTIRTPRPGELETPLSSLAHDER